MLSLVAVHFIVSCRLVVVYDSMKLFRFLSKWNCERCECQERESAMVVQEKLPSATDDQSSFSSTINRQEL